MPALPPCAPLTGVLVACLAAAEEKNPVCVAQPLLSHLLHQPMEATIESAPCIREPHMLAPRMVLQTKLMSCMGGTYAAMFNYQTIQLILLKIIQLKLACSVVSTGEVVSRIQRETTKMITI